MMDEKRRELKDLVGLHELSGCDFDVAQILHNNSYRYYGTINFVLDGLTYSAIEETSNGYLFPLHRVIVTDKPVKHTFPPVRVLCRISPTALGDNLLEIIDAVNGKTVLEVGTRNDVVYCPTFVSDWTPENLHYNEEGETEQSEFPTPRRGGE